MSVAVKPLPGKINDQSNWHAGGDFDQSYIPGYIHTFFELLLSAFSDYFYRCQNHRSRISMTPFKCHLAIYFIFLSIPPRPATAARSHDSINQEMTDSYTYQVPDIHAFFGAGWHRSAITHFILFSMYFIFNAVPNILHYLHGHPLSYCIHH